MLRAHVVRHFLNLVAYDKMSGRREYKSHEGVYSQQKRREDALKRTREEKLKRQTARRCAQLDALSVKCVVPFYHEDEAGCVGVSRCHIGVSYARTTESFRGEN